MQRSVTEAIRTQIQPSKPKREKASQINLPWRYISRLSAVSNSEKQMSIITNKNRKVISFKSSENIQKKEGWSYCTVSNNTFSSVTLNYLFPLLKSHNLILSSSGHDYIIELGT